MEKVRKNGPDWILRRGVGGEGREIGRDRGQDRGHGRGQGRDQGPDRGRGPTSSNKNRN